MKKRILSIFLIFISVITLGLGCKGPDQAAVVQQKQVTLNYWTVFNDVDSLQKLATEYKKKYPYVTVNIRQVRYEEFDRLFVNALADDVAPDIASMHVRWLAKYQNRLAPMPPSVNMTNIRVQGKYAPETIVTEERFDLPSPRAIASAYVPTVANDVVLGNQTYGLPLVLDTMAIYYNKDLLDRAGIPLPPTTWKEFTDAVKQSTRYDAKGDIIQSGVALGTANNIDHAADILALLLMQNKVEVTRGRSVAFAGGLSEGDPGNHPAFAALNFYTDFANPATDFFTWTDRLPNAFQEFTRGKSVFYFGFSFDGQRIRASAPQMNLEAIPVPQLYPGEPVNVANYWVESVVKKSRNQNEAWDFIRFLSLPENIKKYAEATGRPSPLRAQVTAQKDIPLLAPFAASVLQAKNWYTGQNVDAGNDIMKELITNYRSPVGDEEDPVERKANFILNAARALQQTM